MPIDIPPSLASLDITLRPHYLDPAELRDGGPTSPIGCHLFRPSAILNLRFAPCSGAIGVSCMAIGSALSMPASTTAAVCAPSQSAPGVTTPPMVPTSPAQRPTIPVPSAPPSALSYSISRFVDSPASDGQPRPPALVAPTTSQVPGQAEMAAVARMRGILVDIGFPALK
ncbi:hypothetical protein C8034_v002897 [Colletotrichum sidae]|uniref:Uncharacterized protein n=1 Tax=Colletotrichum sidae TaxID=1347389 RepID=A0A4R8TTU3_9PEZI|nr:hypothetical protein C8034_v002897 [Colletotrichum sidae]